MDSFSPSCVDDTRRQAITALLGGTQYFLHLPSFGEFVDQLIEVTSFLDQGVFELFNSVATNDAGNEVGIGIEFALLEERLKVHLVGDQCF